ncbi:MAG TPA: c-type cytochrome [Burkholderiales bacterium]|nr:c-type cytochrome [Burkholderiales bacterium]
MRIAALVLALATVPAAAQDAATRSLAATCATCHGTDGRSATKEVPALAGLPREHVASQMKAFKAGTRPATVMHQIAKGYSDAQIDALAAYFAGVKK